MSASIAKIAKVTNIFLARIIAKSNKNKDLEIKRSQEGPRNVRKYRKNRKSNKDFSCVLKTPVTNIAKITNLTRIKT